jgi:hypothetical protein
VSEINRTGLEEFLRVRRIELAQLGPILQPVRVGFWRQLTPYLNRRRRA